MDYTPQDLSGNLPSSLSLLGKHTIVTGSSRGIGAHTAIALAERGANVAIHYTSESSASKAEAIATKIRSLGRKTCIIHCDLEDPDCGHIIVSQALEGLETRTVDILVNNAAVPGVHKADEQLDPDTFDRIMRVNVRGPMLLVAAILPYFAQRGNRIINIGSIQSRMNLPGLGPYSMSKSALDSLTRTWARELGVKYRCTVNGVLVGPTETDAWAGASEERRKGAISLLTAEKRMGEVEDVSDVVCWLASEGGRW